jgi:hypothetical protein
MYIYIYVYICIDILSLLVCWRLEPFPPTMCFCFEAKAKSWTLERSKVWRFLVFDDLYLLSVFILSDLISFIDLYTYVYHMCFVLEISG